MQKIGRYLYLIGFGIYHFIIRFTFSLSILCMLYVSWKNKESTVDSSCFRKRKQKRKKQEIFEDEKLHGVIG